jgi:ATP-dependent RNA helicase DHX37/DHR1
MRIFADPPDNARLCVVATNIAETSLTIPGIRYVVDSGRVKEKRYDFASATTSFEVTWTSRASADQRCGRAGRTGPGHCYRLYSSAIFANHFEEYTLAEIQRIPIESVVLQMKNMNIDNVINFPFPSAPSKEQLTIAEKTLVHLGALEKETGNITDIGRQMALLPLAPRLSRMIIGALKHAHLLYVIAMAAALTIGDPFDRLEMEDEEDADDDDTEGKNQVSFDRIKHASCFYFCC